MHECTEPVPRQLLKCPGQAPLAIETIRMSHRIDASIGGHIAGPAARAGAGMALGALPARIEFERTPAETGTGAGR